MEPTPETGGQELTVNGTPVLSHTLSHPANLPTCMIGTWLETREPRGNLTWTQRGHAQICHTDSNPSSRFQKPGTLKLWGSIATCCVTNNTMYNLNAASYYRILQSERQDASLWSELIFFFSLSLCCNYMLPVCPLIPFKVLCICMWAFFSWILIGR